MHSAKDLLGRRVHFVGIGGAGMSGIAKIMLSQGIVVSGSDLKHSTVTGALETAGAKIFIGHQAENLLDVDLVVLSTAISESNLERLIALERDIEIISRAEALAILMSGKKSIAVAGTHGKTTTTSMLTVALQSAGLDPSFSIGGTLNASGANAHSGSGEHFIAEADESDGSFLAYKPFGAIITNIELDHVDHFENIEQINSLFDQFVGSIQAGGFIIACHDDHGVQELIARAVRKDISFLTYGKIDSDFQVSREILNPGTSTARITWNGKVMGDLNLLIPGSHNVLNAAAAVAAGAILGVATDQLLEGIASFTGSRRRFELVGEIDGVRVIDDYGHHPTEIRVTLEAARRFVGSGNLFVIFQPHRYSRTLRFSQEFADELSKADRTFLLEVYAASEEPIAGVSSLLISGKMATERVIFEPSMIAVVEKVVELAKPGDLIMTLGAGDVSSLGPVILQALSEKS